MNMTKLYGIIFIMAVVVGGCGGSTMNTTKTCIPRNAGMRGCVAHQGYERVANHDRLVDLVREPRETQVPADDPAHLADFMDTLRPWCPMEFEVFSPQQNAEQALVIQVVVQRFPKLLKPIPPDRDTLRVARYACWALAVYHFGPDPYYWPLEGLHDGFDLRNVQIQIEAVEPDPDNMEDDMQLTPHP